ncbi:arsenite methyltransferase [bacterium]|nr:arsenite methyltransferase [bacterium]
MKDSHDIRQEVSNSYSRWVKRKVTIPKGEKPVQKGSAVKSAGYSEEELSAIPADAVVNSFGCGNPLAFSGVKVGETVVDLGSGAGIDILLAGKIVGETGHVIGVDMTSDMIEAAQRNIQASGMKHVEVRLGLIESLPIEDNSADWVISNCVINLSPEKERVFSEIARVLKPGGKMLVSDIMVDEMPEWVKADSRLYGSCISGAISETDYLQGLKKAGLQEVEVRERLVYDEAQLRGFVESEIETESASSSCGCSCGCDENGNKAFSEMEIHGFVQLMKDKIWSAKVFATKR